MDFDHRPEHPKAFGINRFVSKVALSTTARIDAEIANAISSARTVIEFARTSDRSPQLTRSVQRKIGAPAVPRVSPHRT
jgi:hypothetical protein